MNTESLTHFRHSLAHLLAAAVLHHYPDAKTTIGPAIDTGFYYDFEFSQPVGDNELAKIEETMRTLAPTWHAFIRSEKTKEEALAFFAHNPYKQELIEEIEGTITFYTSGNFTDLCKGGHSEDLASAPHDAWKLERVAGAYWKGDEKNTMLTRIYGLAFETKEKLEAYEAERALAKERDHRKIGTTLDLFTFSPLVGAGLPLWTPRGTTLRNELNTYVWELRKKHGYEQVAIPHITKKDLYETSGHWAKFADELFRITTREGKEYALKPMNCPHHTQIFAHTPRSYRDMPQRYAETTMVYRDEQSGELGGLTRVLSITQDDAHVFCRFNQIEEEFYAVWDIINTFYNTFNFTLRVRLSFHDPKTPEKYLGTTEVWEQAEGILKHIAESRNADYFIAEGEAAMYGPKLDFMAKDSLGREHQVATVQLDMNLPERFDLTCINEKGEKERIVMLHCAIMGSIERFSAVLIEHTAGNFPLFCSPVQVTILPVGEAQHIYAKEVYAQYKAAGIRVEYKTEESLGKRIRQAKLLKTPYIIVIGAKEVESGTITIEKRGEEQNSSDTAEAFLTSIKKEIAERI